MNVAGLDAVVDAVDTMETMAQRAVLAQRDRPLQVVIGPMYVAPVFIFDIAGSEATFETSTKVVMPPGTRLERATFAVGASAAGTTRLGSVADVRKESTGIAVVDFGQMVTVGSLYLAGTARDVTAIERWTGAEWKDIPGAASSMAEVVCDRLRVRTDGSGDVAQVLADDGRVVLPVCPTSLELAVDGQVVWYDRQGSTPDLVTGSGAGTQATLFVARAPAEPLPTVQHATDRTDAVTDALSRAFADPAASPPLTRTVTVTLRSPTPGLLRVAAQVTRLHVQPVDFGTTGAPAPSRGVSSPAEGEVDPLLLPATLEPSDTVREVSWSLTGSVGEERVSPVVEPEVSELAELVLSPGRTTLLGLPRDHVERFATLTGVRLRLRSDQPAEVAGRLLAVDERGRPGEPLPDAVLTATAVPAGDPRSATSWTTLPFAAPVTLPEEPETSGPAPAQPLLRARVAAWLELSPTFGQPVCALTTAASETASAPVHRRLPGGGTRALLEVQAPSAGTTTTTPSAAPLERELTPLEAVVRVVGVPPPTRPIPAVELRVLPGPGSVGRTVAGQQPAAAVPTDPVLADPGRDPVSARVLLPGTWRPEPQGGVRLGLTFNTAADLTLDAVTVAYQKQEQTT